MKDISFDVEVINGNTDYIYRFRSNNDERHLNDFVHRMILNNYIKSLVSYTYEIQDGHRHLRYSISPNMVLSDYLKNRFTDIFSCAAVIVNILKAIKNAEDYMIDRKFLLLNSDYMFLNKTDNTISIMCIPVSDAQEASVSEFMRSIIMPLDFEGIPNSDALKVKVYQYPFDNETTENAIAYFSAFCGEKQKETTAEEKQIAPVQEYTSEQVQHSVIKSKVPSLIKKTEKASKSEDKIAVEDLSEAAVSKADEKKTKDKKSRLFGGLFDSGSKKNKEQAVHSQPSSDNPFGINIPEASNITTETSAAQKASSLFSGINISKPKNTTSKSDMSIEPIKNSAAYMKVEEEEDTVFQNQDESTVFLGEGFSRAVLVDNNGAVYEIVGNAFTIGRTGKGGLKIDLSLPQKTVSHLHATIYKEDGRYFVCDNNSANGTYLDNRRLHPNERKELLHGARLKISNIDFMFELM